MNAEAMRYHDGANVVDPNTGDLFQVWAPTDKCGWAGAFSPADEADTDHWTFNEGETLESAFVAFRHADPTIEYWVRHAFRRFFREAGK